MTNEARHDKQTISDGIHTPVAYEFANATARLAFTNFDEKDRNKFARDLDTNNLFVLIDPLIPTWQQFNAQNGGGEVNTGANVGTGQEIFRDKTGSSLNLRTVDGINDIVANTNGDVVEIDGDGLLPRDGDRPMTGDLNMNSRNIINTNTLTFASEFNIGSVSGSLAINWNNSSFQVVILTGNITSVSFTDPLGVGRYQLRVIQGGAGNFDIAGYPGNVLFGPNATLPIFIAPTGTISIITFFFDGTSYYGILTENFG